MGPPQSNVNTARLDGITQPVRSQFRLFIAGTSGARRVWLFTLVLTALTVCLALVLVPSEPPIPLPFEVPVLLIVGGFYLAEAKVIHLHIGRSAHSFSMSELPLVAGLFLVSPPAFIVARLIGSGLALFFNRRQRSVKLAFNLAQFGLASVVSVAIVNAAVPSDGSFGPALWIAVLVVALVENVIGVLSVSTAISLAEGTAQYRRIPEMLKIGIVVSLTNASLALMALAVLWTNPGSAWLFVLPTITAALAYRAYISERQQHQSIELLYESTRILQRSPQLDTAIVSLLDHAESAVAAALGAVAVHGDVERVVCPEQAVGEADREVDLLDLGVLRLGADGHAEQRPVLAGDDEPALGVGGHRDPGVFRFLRHRVQPLDLEAGQRRDLLGGRGGAAGGGDAAAGKLVPRADAVLADDGGLGPLRVVEVGRLPVVREVSETRNASSLATPPSPRRAA